MVKEDDKAERGSIHTMEDLDGKLFSDWSEYSRKKHKKRMGTGQHEGGQRGDRHHQLQRLNRAGHVHGL